MKKLHGVIWMFWCISVFSCSPVVETSEEFAVNGQHSIQKSIQYLNRIIEHDNSNADALFQRAILELQLEQPLKAKEDIVASLAIEPLNSDYLMLKAKIDAQIGQSNDAIVSIEKILKKGESLHTVEAQLFATNLYLEVNNLNKADYFLQQAALIAPELPEVLYHRARLYTIRHDTARAIAFYLHILSKDSLHKGTITDLAEINLNRHKSDSSLILLSRISNQQSYKYNTLYAKALSHKGLADSAVKFWGYALLLSPRDAQAHYELGKYYFATDFYQNAASHFAGVPENDRNRFKDYYLMYAYSSIGLLDSARAKELFFKAAMTDSAITSHAVLKNKYHQRIHIELKHKEILINKIPG